MNEKKIKNLSSRTGEAGWPCCLDIVEVDADSVRCRDVVVVIFTDYFYKNGCQNHLGQILDHAHLTANLNSFFFRKLFQSTRLYIKGILNGRPSTLCLVNSGNESVFMKFFFIIGRGILSR